MKIGLPPYVPYGAAYGPYAETKNVKK